MLTKGHQSLKQGNNNTVILFRPWYLQKVLSCLGKFLQWEHRTAAVCSLFTMTLYFILIYCGNVMDFFLYDCWTQCLHKDTFLSRETKTKTCWCFCCWNNFAINLKYFNWPVWWIYFRRKNTPACLSDYVFFVSDFHHNTSQTIIHLPVIVLDHTPHGPDSRQVFIIAMRVDVVEGLGVPGIPVGACEVNGNLAREGKYRE